MDAMAFVRFSNEREPVRAFKMVAALDCGNNRAHRFLLACMSLFKSCSGLLFWEPEFLPAQSNIYHIAVLLMLPPLVDGEI